MIDRGDQEPGRAGAAREDVTAPSGNERVRRTKENVLATTFRLMWQEGIGGVTIEEVARVSGVAKTTIYRHWPSRAALLLEACARLSTPPATPDTGSLKSDLTDLVEGLAEQLRTARWPAILPSIIDAAERDPEIARIHAGLQAGFAAPYFAVIERAKRRGELPVQQDAASLVASLVGPLLYRRWLAREAIDDTLVKGVIAAALAAAEP